MSEQELNPLDLARATIGFAGTPVKVKISGSIHEFVRSFNRDINDGNELIHGSFKFQRDNDWELGIYEIGAPKINEDSILKEGWQYYQTLTPRIRKYIIGNYVMHYNNDSKRIRIADARNGEELQNVNQLIDFVCDDIADLRYAMKLLKIK